MAQLNSGDFIEAPLDRNPAAKCALLTWEAGFCLKAIHCPGCLETHSMSQASHSKAG